MCAYRPRLAEVTSLVPNTPTAWLLVVLAGPLAAGLAWRAWADDAPGVVRALLVVLAVGLPLLTQLMPTGRARGGCFLGLWLWGALALGAGGMQAWLAGAEPPWRQPGPEWFEETRPLACAGVELGADFSPGGGWGPDDRVESNDEFFVIHNSVGSKDVTYRQTSTNRMICFGLMFLCAPVPCPAYEGEVICIRGSQLEQNGVVLVEAGDPDHRVTQLFGEDLSDVHRVGLAYVAVTCARGRVSQVVLAETDALARSGLRGELPAR